MYISVKILVKTTAKQQKVQQKDTFCTLEHKRGHFCWEVYFKAHVKKKSTAMTPVHGSQMFVKNDILFHAYPILPSNYLLHALGHEGKRREGL